MYQHILISTDGSEVAQRGVDHGMALAARVGAKVSFVVATDPLVVFTGSHWTGWTPAASDIAAFEESQDAAANALLVKLKQAAKNAGIDAETVLVRNAHPAGAIVDTADDVGADLIVMSSHGRRGIKRLALGSQTNEVVLTSPVPVLVVR